MLKPIRTAVILLRKGLAIVWFLILFVLCFVARQVTLNAQAGGRANGQSDKSSNINNGIPFGDLVLIDEAHTPLSTIGTNPSSTESTRGKYSGFARAIRDIGYTVSTLNPGEVITYSKLQGVACLVIVLSVKAHSDSEIAAISDWVHGGGSLLLISDWVSMDDMQRLARTFGASFGSSGYGDCISDPTDYVGGQKYWIILDRIEEHQITEGVSEIEVYAATNITSTGATTLVTTDNDATWYYRGKGIPYTPVMILIRSGFGQVVIIGDHNLWDDDDSDKDGIKNIDERNNQRLLQNTIRYLAGQGRQEGQQESPREIPAIETAATATAVGVGASAGVAAIMSFTGLGATINSAISGLSIPDWLKDFLLFYGEETFKSLTPEQIDAHKRKRGILRAGQLMAVLLSAVMLFLIYSYVEANGYPNILDIDTMISVIPYVLLTVVFVFLFNVAFSVFVSLVTNVWAETKIWLYGLISFLITGIVFLAPFASPSRTEYEGELDKKRSATIAVLKIVSSLILMVPFYFVYDLGYTIIGDVGLLATTMSACFTSFPTKPLEGEEIFRHSKVIWFGIFFSSFTLYCCTLFKVIPLTFYLMWGVTATFVSIALMILARGRTGPPLEIPPPPPTV